MRLSTKVRYGLRALCHVAYRGYASAQTIADQQAIPSRYLEEIIAELRKAGFVVGKRGPRGGYRLAKPASQITLAEVFEVLAANVSDESDDPDERRQDEITRLVEKAVDRRIQVAVENLDLEKLLGEARETYRQNASNYVI
jgi:Rrf2 family protein